MTRVEQANRYVNLLRDKDLRDYAWVYLAWLRNGAVGIEPGRRGGTRIARIRERLHEFLGPDPIKAAQEDQHG